MGCWAYGGGQYWGHQTQSDVNEVVKAAVDEGINYFDTAEMYNAGASEESIGIALKEYRSQVIIGTKISPSNCNSNTLREHLDASLKRLQTDYVDIYMLHWPIEPHSIEHFTTEKDVISNPPSVEKAFETLKILQAEGKIRYIGVSNHGISQMQEILSTKATLAVNEMPYNLFCRALETEIIPFCKNNGIAVIGYMALMQGILAGIYSKPEDVPQPQAHSRHFKQERGGIYSRHNEDGVEEEMFTALSCMREIAQNEKISVAKLAIAWALANPNVACNLVGSRNLAELNENINCAEYQLPKSIKAELDSLSQPILEKLGPDNPDYYEHRNYSRIR